MGGRISSLSCAPCKKKQARYGVQRRNSSYTRRRYHDSYYDAIGGAVVVSQRRRLGSTRTNRQASLNLIRLSQTEGAQRPQSRNERNSCNGLPSTDCVVHHQLPANRGQCCAADEFLFKGVDSNLKALDCPDISTISMKSGPQPLPGSSLRSSLNGFPPASVCTPCDALRPDDVMFESPLFHSDVTDTTLAVPPNSINSQFLSGINPFSSDDGGKDSASTDSVFEPPQDVLRPYHEEYFSPPTTLMLNNNALPWREYWRHDTEIRGKPPQELEGSGGPGLDSDFGASAGVEMKIVSSDNTLGEPTPAAKARTSAIKRWFPHRGGRRSKKSVRKELLEIGHLDPTSSSLSRLFPSHRPHQPFYFASAPQSCPIPAPDSSLLHVTLEWDPYDPTYERSHWMEYIIPGVTYPPLPQLSDQQYWL